MLRNPELRRALLLGGLVTLLASAAAALLSGWRAACVTLALGTVLLGLYTVELCRRYRAMARLAADIDAVLHGSGDIHLADYGEGEVSLLRSEVRKMTLRLREQSAQLEKEKLQLADAMADISHQMRTPLTAVNLLLTSLAGHVDEESRGDVRALRRQVARMDWLVESLLKLAKLDAGTARFCPETIPLSALLARAAEPFAIGMELRGQQLQVEASGNVRCDPAWTAEALGNIRKTARSICRRARSRCGRRKTPLRRSLSSAIPAAASHRRICRICSSAIIRAKTRRSRALASVLHFHAPSRRRRTARSRQLMCPAARNLR